MKTTTTTLLHKTSLQDPLKILLLRVKMLRKINRMKQGIPKNITTGAKTHRQGCSRNITLIKSPNCPQCTNYSLALPASHISRLPPTYVVFTIKNTVILLWFATSLTNTLSSITVVWTTKSSQLHIGAFCQILVYYLFFKKITLNSIQKKTVIFHILST